MDKKFCPNCGHPLKPNFTHCPNCGYDLIHQSMPQHQQHRFHPRPQQMRSMPQPQSQRQKSGHGLAIVIVILVLVILGGGGYYYYYRNYIASPSTSINNNSSQDSSSSLSTSIAQSKVNGIWSDVQHEINHGDEEDLSDYFQNGSNNHDYKTLSKFANDWNNVDNLDSINLSPQVKSIKANGNTAKVTYQVDYVFNYSNSTKKQGFIWHATMKKSNGSWLFVTNKADNGHPVYNH